MPKRTTKSVSTSECSTCHNEVRSNDFAIACESCACWFHGQCVSLTKADVDTLGRIRGCHWFCERCDDNNTAQQALSSETDKLTKIVSHIETLVHKIPIIETNNAVPVSPSIQSDEFKYQIRISGLPEMTEGTRMERQLHDKKLIDQTLKNIACNFPIKDCFRIGRNSNQVRNRKVIVTLNTVWDARIAVSNAIKHRLFSTGNILITPGLSQRDLETERKLLKKRYELITNGVDRKDLKIRNLKLYQNDTEVNID